MDCLVHGVASSWTQLSDFHFHFTFQVHYTYCVLYFYNSDISFTSGHQALDPRDWGPLPQRTGRCCRGGKSSSLVGELFLQRLKGRGLVH